MQTLRVFGSHVCKAAGLPDLHVAWLCWAPAAGWVQVGCTGCSSSSASWGLGEGSITEGSASRAGPPGAVASISLVQSKDIVKSKVKGREGSSMFRDHGKGVDV